MSKIHYFNWQELKINTNNEPTAILVLLYAGIIGYNKKLCDSGTYFTNKLRIDNIPTILFRRKLLHSTMGTDRKGKRNRIIVSRYECKEPQSYIRNPSFLEANCSVTDKVNFLYLLGNRPISNSNNYIPKQYVSEKYWKNPFIRVDEENLNFTTENTKEKL